MRLIKKFMENFIFITGTDTNIGKTLITCSILRKKNLQGKTTIGYKPISSGAKINLTGIKNYDILQIKKYSNISINLKYLNHITFIKQNSPNFSILNEMKNINFKKIQEQLFFLKTLCNKIIIEGIGGWLTPINKNFYIKNWVIKNNLKIILVIGIKIGCINHALLTIKNILKKKLNIIGWIANCCINNTIITLEYVKFLKKKLNICMLGNIPWLYNPCVKNTIKYINI